ncbi:50S ribosomal protein L24 [Micrococcales bacterium 31B]|nr:50S ribosomal protein L24 [Micrococcales bacterium 31B]
MKIKKGDLVQVITGGRPEKGGDRGKQGKVLAVYPETNRVLVEGVRRVTRHRKATPAGPGGIEHVEAPIHISNVQLVDPETKKPTRVGYRVDEQERGGRMRAVRIRYSKRSGKDI